MYQMMNLPEPEPVGRWLRVVADAGKDAEVQQVRRLELAGRLLSSGTTIVKQSGFADPEHWFTGSVDAAVLKYGWNRPHIVEFKSKSYENVMKMLAREKDYDPAHRRQVMASLGLAHEQHPWKTTIICQETWKIADIVDGSVVCREHGTRACLQRLDLEPAESGSIYYFSRDTPWGKPLAFYEPMFDYDPEFMQEGRRHLSEWREAFLEGRLPERPDGFMWSKGYCKFCDFKKHACRPDDKHGVQDLAESYGIEFARAIRPGYSYDEIRAEVLKHWPEREVAGVAQP
jgi:hypothetical protein